MIDFIKSRKRRKHRKRCVCGHLIYAHDSDGHCSDVFEKQCECKMFVSETGVKNV